MELVLIGIGLFIAWGAISWVSDNVKRANLYDQLKPRLDKVESQEIQLQRDREAWQKKVETEKVELEFEKGELFGLNGKKYGHPTEAIQALQEMSQPYGIGRDVHVGDTIIGIKGRVGFEAAAPLIIIKAHHTLEKHTLTKWQLNWKDQLAMFYGNWLHEGQFHDPIMRNIEAFLTDTQKTVSGKVFVQLMPHRFQIIGIESPHDLMSSKFGSYGEMNNAWTGEDVKGFSKIFGNQVMIYHKVNTGQ